MAMAGALVAITLLLLFHPYRGIWHDSTIYAGQALALLYPEAFSHDLFFAYGSQEKFSAFPALVARLVQQIGLGNAFLWLTLIGLLTFALASWQLLRQLLPESWRFPGLLALILLPASYGAWGILSYAEPFLTARSISEPLALAGLASLLGHRRWLAFALIIVALALHPLQTIPAVVIGWLWLALQDRRWLHLLWSAPLALAACVLLPQLHFLTSHMDPIWFHQVWQRNLVVFYSHADAGDWLYLSKDIFVISVAANAAKPHLRRFLLSVLAASLLLFSASLILADLCRLAWPAGLQLWRAHWLLHWSATAILPWLCMRLWHCHAHDWSRLLVFASAVTLGLMPTGAHPLLPGVILLYLAWPWLAHHIGSWLRKALALLSGLLALSHLCPDLLALAPGVAAHNTPRWVDALQQPRLPAALMLPITLGAVWWWQRHVVRTHWILLPVLSATLLLAACHWDQRSALQRAFTKQLPNAQPFGVRIAPDEQVIWLGNLLPAWSVLHRPYYIQQQQLSGIVFNRATSIEGYRRKELMHVLDAQGHSCRVVAFPKEPFPACRPDDAAVRHACSNAGGALSYFILDYPLQMQPRGAWTPGGGATSTYYLYACKDFSTSTPPMQPQPKHPLTHASAP